MGLHTLFQQSYLEKLSSEDFEALTSTRCVKDKNKLLDTKGQNVFRKAVGSIGWVAQVSRPDLSYAHINFACKSGRATVEDGRKIARMINKLAETKYDIRFSNLGNIEELKLVTFADASPSHNNIVETFIGSITFLENEEGKMNVVDWKTKNWIYLQSQLYLQKEKPQLIRTGD